MENIDIYEGYYTTDSDNCYSAGHYFLDKKEAFDFTERRYKVYAVEPKKHSAFKKDGKFFLTISNKEVKVEN